MAAVSITSSARYSMAGATCAQNGHANSARGGSLGAGEIGTPHSGQAKRAAGEDLAAVGDEARVLADRGAAGAPLLDVGLAAVAGVRCDLERHFEQ